MSRIAIVGTAGSGKTTLGGKIAQKLSLPLYELDDYYWSTNWQPRKPEDFAKDTRHLVMEDKWIVTGNYTPVREIVWTRADTVIWLDYGMGRCLWWAFKRTVLRIRSQEPVCNGNIETFRRAFLSPHSILWWILTSFYRRRRNYQHLCKLPPPWAVHVRWIHIRTPQEAQTFLKSLG